jgi:hypothetical protein
MKATVVAVVLQSCCVEEVRRDVAKFYGAPAAKVRYTIVVKSRFTHIANFQFRRASTNLDNHN